MSKNDVTDEFRTREVTIRGKVYKFRELSASDYDEIVKIASGPEDQAELATVLKMMAVKSIIEPAMTADEMSAKPYPVYNKMLQTVNEMHFSADAVKDGETAPNS